MATPKEAFQAYLNNGAQITLVTIGVLAAFSAWRGRGSGNYGAGHMAHVPPPRHHARSGRAPARARARGSRKSSYQKFTSQTMRRLIAQGHAPKDAMRESARMWRQKTGR